DQGTFELGGCLTQTLFELLSALGGCVRPLLLPGESGIELVARQAQGGELLLQLSAAGPILVLGFFAFPGSEEGGLQLALQLRLSVCLVLLSRLQLGLESLEFGGALRQALFELLCAPGGIDSYLLLESELTIDFVTGFTQRGQLLLQLFAAGLSFLVGGVAFGA